MFAQLTTRRKPTITYKRKSRFKYFESTEIDGSEWLASPSLSAALPSANGVPILAGDIQPNTPALENSQHSITVLEQCTLSPPQLPDFCQPIKTPFQEVSVALELIHDSSSTVEELTSPEPIEELEPMQEVVIPKDPLVRESQQPERPLTDSVSQAVISQTDAPSPITQDNTSIDTPSDDVFAFPENESAYFQRSAREDAAAPPSQTEETNKNADWDIFEFPEDDTASNQVSLMVVSRASQKAARLASSSPLPSPPSTSTAATTSTPTSVTQLTHWTPALNPSTEDSQGHNIASHSTFTGLPLKRKATKSCLKYNRTTSQNETSPKSVRFAPQVMVTTMSQPSVFWDEPLAVSAEQPSQPMTVVRDSPTPSEPKAKRNLIAHLKNATGKKVDATPQKRRYEFDEDEEISILGIQDEQDASITTTDSPASSPPSLLSHREQMERELMALMADDFNESSLASTSPCGSGTTSTTRCHYQPQNRIHAPITYQRKIPNSTCLSPTSALSSLPFNDPELLELQALLETMRET